MADLARIKKKYETPEIDIEEATNGGNRYSLPYGLCKSVGINTEGMTPREAWDAWQNKTGKTKEEAEREHWGKTADEKQPQNENSKENTSESVIKSKVFQSKNIIKAIIGLIYRLHRIKKRS